jgi:hypothetical protein
MQLYLARNNGIIARPQADRAPHDPRGRQALQNLVAMPENKECTAAVFHAAVHSLLDPPYGSELNSERNQSILQLTRAWPRLASPLALQSRGHSLPAQPVLDTPPVSSRKSGLRRLKHNVVNRTRKRLPVVSPRRGTQPCVAACYPAGYRSLERPCADEPAQPEKICRLL